MDFGGQRYDVEHLVEYVETATSLGFDAIAANDHMVFTAPWLDGPTALASVVSCSGDAELFTTVANPVVRGPVALAKVLAGLDLLSGGRLVAALGPGSSQRDYASVGVPFQERWPRFDETVRAMRALLSGLPFEGRFYSAEDRLEPLPARPDGPPLWVGSWGSDVGLRRAVRLGDGWLASAYNTTPEQFADAWRQRGAPPRGVGTRPGRLRERAGHDVVPRRRPRRRRGPRRAAGAGHASAARAAARTPPLRVRAEAVAEKLAAFRDAGVQRVFLWPVVDEVEQLRRFSEEVMPLLEA